MRERQMIVAIVVGSAIIHNGKHYQIGDEIEVTEQEYHQNSLYLQPKDEAIKARQEAQAEAEAKAKFLAEEAQAEKQALQTALAEAQEAHTKAEALASENGLRAEEAEARIKELEAQLAKKESEIATLSAELTACKAEKPKSAKTKEA